MKILAVVLYLAIALLLIRPAYGQSRLSGQVSDPDGRPVIGANVMLVDTYDGASTDLEGRFSFLTGEQGPHLLQVTYLGFTDHQQAVQLDQDSLYFIITLRENAFELADVVITAGAFEAGDEHKREVLKPLDIVTTAGATADIAGALNTLPGTTTVGESGRLFVRGGEGYETGTFIDGMQVMNFYRPSAPNTPGRSRFMPFMFSGASFSTGGYSAEYGQALSSALILQSKFLAPQERTDISLMSVGVDATTTQTWDGASLSLKGQYTNLDPYTGLIDQEIDWIDAPTSWEGNAAYRQKLGGSGILKVFGNFNRSELALDRRDLLRPEVRIRNHIANRYGYLNAVFSEEIGREWTLRGGLSYTDSRDEIELGAAQVRYVKKGLHAKTVAAKQLSGSVSIKLGSEYFNRRFLQHYRAVDSEPFQHRGFTDNLGALFAESDVYLTGRLLARIGLRSEYTSLTRDLHLAPRLSLAYKTTENSQVSAAFGHFRQAAQNEWLIADSDLSQEQAEHYILNYQLSHEQRIFRIEAYHKQYRDLVKFERRVNEIPVDLNNSGTGYARGLDLFWRDGKTLRNLDYWLSYSFLDTKRNYRDFPEAVTPPFAARHNFSAVGKFFIPGLKSQVGLTYTVTSQRTYHNPNRPGFMNSQTPAYQDLSVNLSYLFRQHIILHLSASNVLGQEQRFGYEYAPAPNENGLYPGRPIRPPAKRFLFVGVFITFSPEAVLNQLPNL